MVIGLFLKLYHLSELRAGRNYYDKSYDPVKSYKTVMKHSKHDPKARAEAAYQLITKRDLNESQLEQALGEEGALNAIEFSRYAHDMNIYGAYKIYKDIPQNLRTERVTIKAIEGVKDDFYFKDISFAIPRDLLRKKNIAKLVLDCDYSQFARIPEDAMDEENLSFSFSAAKASNYRSSYKMEYLLNALPKRLLNEGSLGEIMRLGISLEAIVKNRRKIQGLLNPKMMMLMADSLEAWELPGLYMFFRKGMGMADSKIKGKITENFASKLKDYVFVPERYVVDMPYQPAGYYGGYDGGSCGPWENPTWQEEMPEEGHTNPSYYNTDEAKALLRKFPKSMQSRMLRLIPRKDKVILGFIKKAA